MVIREAGLLFRGFTLVKKSYHKTTLGKIDADLRSGLLTALLNFAETAFSTGAVEYFEGNKFTLVFNNEKILAEDSTEPELLVSYAIIERRINMDNAHGHILLFPFSLGSFFSCFRHCVLP